LLFSLQPETLSRRCQDFHQRYGELAGRDPQLYFDLYVDFAVQGVNLWRPAIQAALELGVETFWNTLDWAMKIGVERFRDMKRIITPGISEDALDELEYSLRRSVLGACLDRQITPEALRSEIYAIFGGYAADAQRRHLGGESIALASLARA